MNDASQKTRSTLAYPKFRRHFTEFIGIGANDHLWVDGCDTVELAERYGTPLYVTSENQFRHNYRGFYDAFAKRYPQVQVLFANKCNNSLAVRHIMNQEGAGGDAFGVNEMYFALLTGMDGRKLVLNGSNKDAAEIEMAVRNRVCVNIDAMDELDIIAATAERLGIDAEVGVRLKLDLKPLENRFATELHGPGSLAEQGRDHKWGMPYAQTVELIKKIQKIKRLHPVEVSYHLSRMDNKADDFAVMAREMVQWVAKLRDDTGWTASWIDLGGGWATGRPEKTGPDGADDDSTPSYDEYAEAVCTAIKDECKKLNLKLPGIKIEPGRAVAAKCGILIGRVGAVKEWPERKKKWVNLDASATNHLFPAASQHWYYHAVVANKVSAPLADPVDIVGPLCTPDILASQRAMPKMIRGDLVAFLDAGSYAEPRVSSFNAQLKPATVMVSGGSAFVTTERERLSDVLGRYRVPSHLIEASFGRGTSIG